jgi:hypothetical protein
VPDPGTRKPMTRKGLVAAGIWGATTTVLAYVLSFGSIPLFIALMVAFGVLLRLAAFAVMKQRGERPPRGWWV